MALRHLASAIPLLAALGIAPAAAQVAPQIGLLSCDVSSGVGLIIMQKQSMTCSFRRTGSSTVERYTGTINEYGLELCAVEKGHLVWAVGAATQGVPAGALSGTYIILPNGRHPDMTTPNDMKAQRDFIAALFRVAA